MSADLIWQQLAQLKPSLPRHIVFQRRQYQDEIWHLLQDKTTGRFHRLNASAYQLLNLMDGRRNLQQILQLAELASSSDATLDAPTRDDLIHLIQYLHVADLLVCDMPPSTQELFGRRERLRNQSWRRLLSNPYTWKISLGNPDRLLNGLLPLGRKLATQWMGYLWLATITFALVLVAQHWPELTQGGLDHLLSPANLFLLWLTYPFLKILHELGHGIFTKVWGGEVHECGVVFILGTPLPYVDATAATGFAHKSQRLMVSAAGMAVELFLAALALIVWVQLDDGLARDILFNVMVIGGVSTLFFNGNPLMRFDGYHLLTDAIDQPNLATRANKQLGYLVNRYIYAAKDTAAISTSAGESIFLASYSLSAFIYRLFVFLAIIKLAASYFPLLGIVLAVWLLVFQIMWPSFLYVQARWKTSRQQGNPTRVLSIWGAIFASLILLTSIIPMPYSTQVQGVVWLAEDSQIKAQALGEITQVLVKEGDSVSKGQVLIQLSNPQLQSQLLIKQAQVAEFNARYQQIWLSDRAQAQLLEQEMDRLKAEANHLQQQINNLNVVSPSDGIFRSTRAHLLVGSYAAYGDVLGIIDNQEPLRIRVAVTQEDIGAVRQHAESIAIKFSSIPLADFSGELIEQVPSATFELPSPVLGVQGGGTVVLDANSSNLTRTAKMIFVMDIGIARDAHRHGFGERAYVRFNHKPEPVVFRIYRSFQQAFIRGFKG